MGFITKVLHFIGGKPNGKFNSKGEIENDLTKQKWKKWEGRFLNNAQYNWRSHSGTSHKGLKDSKKKT